jgi:ribonuclease HII
VVKFDRQSLPPSPDLSFESVLWEDGARFVAGLDEAGRGALAGPVAAAAVVLPVDHALCQVLSGVRDSKEMSPIERERWAEQLPLVALACGVGFASNGEIDAMGIVAATRLAMVRALRLLAVTPQHLLLDFIDLPECLIPQTALVKGDARCLSIASASVLAKVTRDATMRQLEEQYPGYGFASHKGYGTEAHRLAIERLGPSPVHRYSFRTSPVSKSKLPQSG